METIKISTKTNERIVKKCLKKWWIGMNPSGLIHLELISHLSPCDTRKKHRDVRPWGRKIPRIMMKMRWLSAIPLTIPEKNEANKLRKASDDHPFDQPNKNLNTWLIHAKKWWKIHWGSGGPQMDMDGKQSTSIPSGARSPGSPGNDASDPTASVSKGCGACSSCQV